MLVLRCGVLLLHMLVRGFVCSPLYKLQVPACGQALLPSNVEPLPACDPLCGAGLTCRMAVATTVDQGAKYKVLGENATQLMLAAEQLPLCEGSSFEYQITCRSIAQHAWRSVGELNCREDPMIRGCPEPAHMGFGHNEE